MTAEPVDVFLKLAEPIENSNRFFLGAFQGGITLYKQQVRALNLLYAIQLRKRLQPGARIAVIGGGVSGVTAAAAAAALGYEIYLFERRPILLHLQHGCDTRWVHPHLYDWPDPGSERPYAELPLLNWREGTASEVTEQLEKGFQKLLAAPAAGQLRLHTGVEVEFEEPLRVRWSNSRGIPKSGAESFSSVIFAVGFGVERQVDKKLTHSYWRNDSFNQPEPGASANEKATFLISGTGDGGLIDLLRARIESFNQGRILRDLIDSDDVALVSALRRIKKQWGDESRGKNSTWLYDQYSKLYQEGLVSKLRDRLKNRLRRDTEAVLNGEAKSLSYALRLDKASLFNTLLVHNLDALNAFDYLPGGCKPYGTSGVVIKNKRYLSRKHNIIIRHGTDRDAVFKAAECEDELKRLKTNHEAEKQFDTSSRIWPAGWWEHAPSLGGERREFVPPAMMTIAATFVSTLSDIIKLLHRKTVDLQFRATLHRLINVQGEDYYQQISRYAGTRTEGAVGRVFEVKGGLVGLACRLGRPVIVRRDETFDEVWNYLALKKVEARDIDERVQSLLACPFFAPTAGVGKPTPVALVLFMDSAQRDFFDVEDNQVLKSVYAACHGFVQNLETMKETGEVVFSSSDYVGYEYTEPKKDIDFVEKYESVEVENKVFESFIRDLTFKTIASFDAELETLQSLDKKNVIPS
ncbi:MAG: FAD-dependent oxidoreductase [Acidobacteria bacterium]|nr:FAD-dependent oxidoreductase [Acidobacteriota bacterium]